MSRVDAQEVRQALIAAGITGPHASHPRIKNLRKVHSLLEGDSDDSFGLSGIEQFSASEVLSFMAELVGCSPDIADLECEDLIDPDKTMAGIEAAAERLASAARNGASLLVVTGHPTGMLHHHIKVAEAYREAGGKLLALREDESLPTGRRASHAEVRYVGGVGCLADWGSLKHTHSSLPMEALLEAEPWPDLVLGDHGFAGAAIERDIPTIAVMDINDHALAVASAQGKDVTIIPMDDNRPPRLYEPSWMWFSQRILGSRNVP